MMKKVIVVLVVVLLSLLVVEAMIENRIEEVKPETKIEEIEISEQDQLILLAISAGATEMVIEADKLNYTLDGMWVTVYEGGYKSYIKELSSN